MEGFAYPSGHSTTSYLLCYVLSELYPKYKKNFEKIKTIISNIIPINIINVDLMDRELFANKFTDTIIPLQILPMMALGQDQLMVTMGFIGKHQMQLLETILFHKSKMVSFQETTA